MLWITFSYPLLTLSLFLLHIPFRPLRAVPSSYCTIDISIYVCHVMVAQPSHHLANTFIFVILTFWMSVDLRKEVSQIKAHSLWGGIGNQKAKETLMSGPRKRYITIVKGERVSRLQSGVWEDSWRQKY